MCSKTQLFKPFQTPLEICADIRTSGVQNDVCVRHTYYYLKYVLIDKAMKSSPLLKPVQMEDPYPVENIDRLGDSIFQASDNSQLLRRVL